MRCIPGGGYWGLACNALHLLDLVEWFATEDKLRIVSMNLSDRIEESKRKGYVEVFGSIVGTCGRCENWSISCFADSRLPFVTEIVGDRMWCSIDYGSRRMKFACAAAGWQEEALEFDIPYQSELTQQVVSRILETGTCNLPKYEDSMRQHLIFMQPLIKFFENKGMEKEICPIT